MQLLKHAKPAALFVGEAFEEHIENISSQLGKIKLIDYESLRDEDTSVWYQAKEVQNKQQKNKTFQLPTTTSDEDGLLLCYTSGTTGVPKGALLSKKALMCNSKNSIDMHQLTAKDTVLTLLPMFHVGGLNIQTLPALRVGASIVLLNKFEIGGFYQAFKNYPITLTLVVPTLMFAVMADQGWQNLKAKDLRLIAIGSSVVPDSLVTSVCSWGGSTYPGLWFD